MDNQLVRRNDMHSTHTVNMHTNIKMLIVALAKAQLCGNVLVSKM